MKMKVFGAIMLLLLLSCCSCSHVQKLTHGLTVEKAVYEKDLLGSNKFTLTIRQKGGFGQLEKDGTPYEKVVLRAGVQQKTDSGWESLAILLDSMGTEVIKENDVTEVLFYPWDSTPFTPQEGVEYRLYVQVRVTYEGWDSLLPDTGAPEPDTEEFPVQFEW